MEKVVGGCKDNCPFLSINYDSHTCGYAFSYTCRLLEIEHYEDYDNRKEVDYFIDVQDDMDTDSLITPESCPLKREKLILITWKE